MDTHEQIDRRSLLMAQAIVAKIDADPQRAGLSKARNVCRHWMAQRTWSEPAAEEWAHILGRPWEAIRQVLLDDSQEGQRLRQSSPFCGVLTAQERWDIYKKAQADETYGA